MGRARTVTSVLALAMAMTVAAGCGTEAVISTRSGLTTSPTSPTSHSTVNEAGTGTVPWVDRPGQMFVPEALPTPTLPANAPPCTAAGLAVSPDGSQGGGGQLDQMFSFRNVSTRTCILSGYPRVVVSEPGKPDVTAREGGSFLVPGRSADMAPGGVTTLAIETDVDCGAHSSIHGFVPGLIYHTVTVGIPGGGQVRIHASLDVLCGVFAGNFGVAQPTRRYTSSPVQGATVAIELPSSVEAGSTLHYVVALTNPTGRTMALHPCPSYTQTPGTPEEGFLQLNCDTIKAVAPHQTVRYAMQLRMPADQPTGLTTVCWSMAITGFGGAAHASLVVRAPAAPPSARAS